MSSQTQFDLKKFNKAVEEKHKKDREARERAEKIKLDSMKKTVRRKKLHEMSILEVLINIKRSIFGLLTDILTLNISTDIFVKNDRIMFIGIGLLLASMLIYLFDIIIL